MAQPIKLIQVTDLHLFESRKEGVGWCDAYPDLDTSESLKILLQKVEQEEADISAYVVTGDIAQKASTAVYSKFQDFFQPPHPVFCIPGNHDELMPMMESVSKPHVQIGGHRIEGRWLLVFLDSSRSNDDPSGYLAQSELARMQDLLDQYPELHCMVFVHHHPVDIGSEWLDKIGITNKLELIKVLTTSSRIRAVVFGHIHQEFDNVMSGIRMLGSPSTCIQFASGKKDFSCSTLPPAYRWLKLYDDGELETGVRYV